MSDAFNRIIKVVNAIPEGQVATYGQVATLAGLPRRARLVGHVLSRLPDSDPAPWHRVINGRGMISQRSKLDGYEDYQRILLEQEGIVFGTDNRVALHRYQWKPQTS